MSCTPSISIARSLSPLSPSDESRFVPHPSLVDASSAMERHFTATEAEAANGEKVHHQDETESASSNTQGPNKEPAVVVDGKKSGMILGATICFTPEPSPPSSPIFDRGSSNLDSLNSGSIDYIGSVNAVGSGDSGMEGASSKLSSSAKHVASSLDGRSTTEYEILDGISSKGTIEVEDMSSEGEDEEEFAGVEEKMDVLASALASLSPSSTVISLSDTPLRMFKTPHPDEEKTPQVADEVKTLGIPVVPGQVHSHTLMRSEALKLDLSPEDNTAEKDPAGADSPNTSPKVDERPLSPFNTLHKYWEGQSTFTCMTNSVIGRILGIDEHKEAKSDIGANAKGSTEFKTPVNAESTTGEQSFSFDECTQQPSGTDVDETGSVEQGQEAYMVQTIPKTSAICLLLAKVKDTLSGFADSVVSFTVSLAILIGMSLYGHISSILGKMSAMFGRILLGKFMGGMTTQGTIEVEKTQQKQACTSDMGPKDNFEQYIEHTATNLSKLFLDEAVEEERKLGLAEESALQTEVEVEGPKESSSDDDAAALDQTEKALLKRITDKVIASITSKCSYALSFLRSTKVLHAITSWALISIFVMFIYMLQHDIEAIQSSIVDVQEEPFDVQSIEENDLHCYSNHMATFVSIPVWEFSLMTSFEAFEVFDEALISEQASDDEAGSSTWLPSFVIPSIAISLLCAFIFKSKIPFHPIKPKRTQGILTGLWTEEEHEQFVSGYNAHGSRWKLVAAFVPTRSHTQVKSHGSYWLKIRSPERMTKTRKVGSTFSNTPNQHEKKTREAPSSVSSTKSTPRKSNRAKVPPLKGILIAKDNNQLYKNVTPRSEGRTRRMRKAQGPKSDPGKRVKIQIP